MGRQTKRQRDRKAAKKQRPATPVEKIISDVKEPVHVQQADTYRRFGSGEDNPRVTVQQPRRQGKASTQEAIQALAEQLRTSLKGATVKPSETQTVAAQRRMEALHKLLSTPPTPILDQLTQVGVPWKMMRNVPTDRAYDTVVIKLSDINAADLQIARRGTLYDQLYRGEL